MLTTQKESGQPVSLHCHPQPKATALFYSTSVLAGKITSSHSFSTATGDKAYCVVFPPCRSLNGPAPFTCFSWKVQPFRRKITSRGGHTPSLCTHRDSVQGQGIPRDFQEWISIPGSHTPNISTSRNSSLKSILAQQGNDRLQQRPVEGAKERLTFKRHLFVGWTVAPLSH